MQTFNEQRVEDQDLGFLTLDNCSNIYISLLK